MFLQTLLHQSPKKIFLIDSLGALLTSIMLGLVLPKFQSIFAIPLGVLKILALIALVFCLYSSLCLLIKLKNWRIFLKIIAVANLLYCLLTLGTMFYLQPVLTAWDFTYFTLEIVVIAVLVKIELKVASSI